MRGTAELKVERVMIDEYGWTTFGGTMCATRIAEMFEAKLARRHRHHHNHHHYSCLHIHTRHPPAHYQHHRNRIPPPLEGLLSVS